MKNRKVFWIFMFCLLGGLSLTSYFFWRRLYDPPQIPGLPTGKYITADIQFVPGLKRVLKDFKKTHPETNIEAIEVFSGDFGDAYFGVRTPLKFKNQEKIGELELLAYVTKNLTLKALTQKELIRYFFPDGKDLKFKGITRAFTLYHRAGIPQALQKQYAKNRDLGENVLGLPDPFTILKRCSEDGDLIGLIPRLKKYKLDDARALKITGGNLLLSIQLLEKENLTKEFKEFLETVRKPENLKMILETELNYTY